MNWKNLTSQEELKAIDELSKEKSVAIFKHSTRCSISATALNRLERKWKADNDHVEPYFLDLIANREVSNEIANYYGIEHQSPQILLIKNGECVYDNSHLGISYDELIENADPVSI